jgi:hypothetical protein
LTDPIVSPVFLTPVPVTFPKNGSIKLLLLGKTAQINAIIQRNPVNPKNI